MACQKLKNLGLIKIKDDEIIFEPKKNLSQSNENEAKKLKKRWIEGIVDTKYGGGAGYRLEERELFNNFIEHGFVDVYRNKYPKKYGFTYWDMTKPLFRGINYGLRLDYFMISKKIINIFLLTMAWNQNKSQTEWISVRF